MLPRLHERTGRPVGRSGSPTTGQAIGVAGSTAGCTRRIEGHRPTRIREVIHVEHSIGGV